MFDNKFTRRDPLVESVRQVMIENDIRRQVELTLNEQLGIQSRKQLPHEYLKEYDETLMAAINQTLNEGKGRGYPLGNSGSGSQSKSPKETPEFTKEELVGRQHEIDANRNGKIDPTDFKLLRAKKRGMKEELNAALGKNKITRKDPAVPSALAEKLTKKIGRAHV
mgnify:FL=1